MNREANNPDYSKLQLTNSDIPILFEPKLRKYSDELLTLEWEDKTKRFDKINLIIFSSELNKYYKVEASIKE
ncbi:MAG: hypothetical protein KDK36_22265, partial [Leptospiraceae bacterium]|nr:hypothetical protein [Leptospiraceae bacterium]